MSNLFDTVRYFPLRRDSKLPAVAKWQEVATNNDDQITAWTQMTGNFGLVADSLVILDVDNATHGGKDGYAVLTHLIEKHTGSQEAPIDFFDTYTVRTASGGFHLYFEPLPEKKYVKGANKLGEGLDIQTGNAYVVAVGSTIPGSKYGSYECVNMTRVQPLPEWLSELIESKPQTLPSVSEKGGKPISDRYVRGVVRSYLKRLDECSEKGWGGPPWDETCFKVAASLIEISNNPHNKYPHEDALADFLHHAPTDEGFGYDLHMQKWESAKRKVGANQRTLDREDQERREEISWQERIERVKKKEETVSTPTLLQVYETYAARIFRTPSWENHPKVAVASSKLIAMLRTVQTEEDARTWMDGAKMILKELEKRHGDAVRTADVPSTGDES